MVLLAAVALTAGDLGFAGATVVNAPAKVNGGAAFEAALETAPRSADE